jgi:hypothetical protein
MEDLKTVSQVCKGWNRCSSSNELWKPFLAQKTKTPKQYCGNFDENDCLKKYYFVRYHGMTKDNKKNVL